MLAHERKQFILDMLKKNKSVTVTQLSELLNTSEVTIRRYLNELEDSKALKRIHGGAVRNASTAFEPQIFELELENVEKKKAIVQKAYELIKDNDAIIIDSSSTSAQLASLIGNGKKRNITIVTNSFKTAWELMYADNVELIHIGGQVRSNVCSSIGSIAETTLRGLRVDKAFIGINGISFEDGFTTPNLFESQIKRAMMNSAYKVYILADSSKFNQTYLSIVCPISRVDYLITDSDITEKDKIDAEQNELKLIIADVETANPAYT